MRHWTTQGNTKDIIGFPPKPTPATCIWSPTLKREIEIIERVQQRATKIVPGLTNISYHKHLIKLGLPILAYRRVRFDMIELNGYDYVNGINNKLLVNQVRRTRCHSVKLIKPRCRKSLRKHSFSLHSTLGILSQIKQSQQHLPLINLNLN